MNNTEEEINLLKIKSGFPGLTKAMGNYFYEACSVTMHRAGHAESVIMNLSGDNKKNINLLWKDIFDEQLDRAYKEDSSLIDASASCLACLIALHETDYTIVERGYKGSGFDYYLGYKNAKQFFAGVARLEISGIKTENEGNSLEKRFKEKLIQTSQSDNTDLPAYVSVVEFSKPRAI